jgi:hypothetical protein
MANHWMQWLNNIPVEEQKNLLSTLRERYPDTANDVQVTRIPAEELLIVDPPPYVDIFKLHNLYNKTAFGSNLLLKGPKGDGKSLSFFDWAAKRSVPLISQECSEGTKETHLMGSQTLLGDRTVFVLGAIPSAIDVANEVGECVLLFEELNALTPQVQKMLNAVGDFRKACSMPAIKKTYRLKPGKKLWVVATMNPSVYGGTYDLNEDLKSRFNEADVTYPEAGLEKQVLLANIGNQVSDDILSKVIRLGTESRGGSFSYKLSTRDLVSVLKNVLWTDLQTALQLVVCKFEGEDRKLIITRITSIFGNSGIKEYWS